MTSTASSSPILLLTSATPGAVATSGSGVQAAPDAALGGFELLLGAMQQLQQELEAAVADGEPAQGDGEPSGNVLPPLGMLLPVSGKAAGVTGDELVTKEGMTDKKDGEGMQAQDAKAGADFLLFSAMQSAPVAVSSPAMNGDAVNAAGSNSQNGAVSADIATLNAVDKLMPQIAAGAGTTNKDTGNGKTDRTAALSLKLGSIEPARASDTVSANSVETAKLAQDGLDIAPAVDSDFESFVKHFEAASSSPATGSPAVGDSAAINQASRTYSSAAAYSAANNSATVPVPVGNDGWSEAIADKVMWFGANKITSAEIHLNPPDLGPLQVRVSTQQDQASVVFTSQHAAVRDALDQALPRLRDMMGSQGMQLLDVSVGSQTPQQQQQQYAQNDPSQSGTRFGGVLNGDAADPTAANITAIDTARLQRSGFDAYA